MDNQNPVKLPKTGPILTNPKPTGLLHMARHSFLTNTDWCWWITRVKKGFNLT